MPRNSGIPVPGFRNYFDACERWENKHYQPLLFFNSVFFVSLQLKLPQIQKIMMEFEKQSEIMDMKEEMMSDAIDDAMGDEDDEEET